MRLSARFFTLLLALICLAQPAFAANYAIDTDHSTVSFKVKHLFSNVQGQFKTFEGRFVYDADKPETWQVEAVIQADSIDTNVAERDKHLKSKDFLDTEIFPEINFKSTGISEVTEQRAKLSGLLTIHGVEKPVVLDLEILGVAKDPWGNVSAGFSATVKISRQDFGLTWNQAIETGGFLVGEDVIITLEIAGLLQE